MNRDLERFVWRRARERCEYCRLPQAVVQLPHQIDHIIAEQHGGETIKENLALACLHCNKHKGPNIAGMDPETEKPALLFHPRRQKWNRHFRWRGAIIEGLTQTGRATVRALAMNAAALVALRQELLDEGVSL